MKNNQVTCDFCQKDLTYASNCVEYRLVLASEAKPHAPGGGAVTAMMIYPLLDSDAHFCGWTCLKKWINKE